MALAAPLRTYLISLSTLTALVGTRIYPVIMPQNPVLPLLTYQVITDNRTHTMEGAGVPNPYVQIDVWALTYSEVEVIADILVDKLSGFRGSFGALPVSGMFLRGRQDLYEVETKNFRISTDFSIWHN